MSVRAYRVNRLEYNDVPTFNLWHDTDLLEFLQREGIYFATAEDGGWINAPVDVLIKAVKQATKLKLEDYHITALKDDIAFAKETGDSHIFYHCF